MQGGSRGWSWEAPGGWGWRRVPSKWAVREWVGPKGAVGFKSN